MKNKGFTLIELLAVIIILSILMTLGYVGVSQYLDRTRDTVYLEFEENIKSAAENYLISHTGSIPEVGETLIIDASKLTCDEYLSRLKDPKDKTNSCNVESYAIIKRNADNSTSGNFDIEYTACLKCKNYTSSSCLSDITGIKRLTKSDTCEVD